MGSQTSQNLHSTASRARSAISTLANVLAFDSPVITAEQTQEGTFARDSEAGLTFLCELLLEETFRHEVRFELLVEQPQHRPSL